MVRSPWIATPTWCTHHSHRCSHSRHPRPLPSTPMNSPDFSASPHPPTGTVDSSLPPLDFSPHRRWTPRSPHSRPSCGRLPPLAPAPTCGQIHCSSSLARTACCTQRWGLGRGLWFVAAHGFNGLGGRSWGWCGVVCGVAVSWVEVGGMNGGMEIGALILNPAQPPTPSPIGCRW